MNETEGMTCYITRIDNSHPRHLRSHIIIHRPDGFYLAEFNTMKQLDVFANRIGFKYTVRKDEQSPKYGRYTEFDIDRKFVDGAVHCGFMSAKELPEGATPFLALSNGRIATCYFVNDGETITIYRPNPNSRLYDPLELYADIGHRHQYGVY